MAGDELMKSIFGLSQKVVWLLVVVFVFIVFNIWLMRQVEDVVGRDVLTKRPARAVAAVPSGAHIPVIDRQNDLLAPVTSPESPQMYLKRRLQKNTDEKEYGLPKTGLILND